MSAEDHDTIRKAYKFRIYPNAEQREFFDLNFRCCRFVYNHFLAVRQNGHARKVGIESLNEAIAGGMSCEYLDSIIEREAVHFENIYNGRCSTRNYEIRLLENFVPDVYLAYWRWFCETGRDPGGELKSPTFYDTSKALKVLKNESLDENGRKWLYDADAVALVYELRNLDAAFKNFFDRYEKAKMSQKAENAKNAKKKKKSKKSDGDSDNAFGYPRFKNGRTDRKSYKTSGKGIVFDDDFTHIKLPKCGWVSIKAHREVEGDIVSVTISLDSSGRYYASVGCKNVPRPVKERTGKTVAVERGVTHLAVTSDGVVFDKPRSYARLEKRLAREHRRLSRKQGANKGEKPSNRYIKQRKRVARLEVHVAASRNDFLHKTSKAITDDADVIVLRKNETAEMLLNQDEEKREVPREVEKLLHRNISDAGMYELERQIRYKSDWLGNEVVTVSNEFPSTQMCSSCGYVNEALKGIKGLSIRSWVCPECGARHERDFNSATNLLQEGQRLMAEP